MSRILNVIDKTNRKISLSNERYKHITKHPEMQNKLDEIRDTLISPIKITDFKIDKNIKYYYKYYKDRKSKAKYLRVIVKYLNGEGFIITAYYIENIK
jgi:hypothetical protein